MKPPRQPLYLARQSYRRRRLMDAARLLPALGLFLFALPLLWPADPATPDVAREALYVFGVWAGLVVLAMVLSARLVDTVKAGSEGGDGADPLADADTPPSGPAPDTTPDQAPDPTSDPLEKR